MAASELQTRVVDFEPSEALNEAIAAHWAAGEIAADIGNQVSDLITRVRAHTLREPFGFTKTQGRMVIEQIRAWHPGRCEIRGSAHCRIIQEFVNAADRLERIHGS